MPDSQVVEQPFHSIRCCRCPQNFPDFFVGTGDSSAHFIRKQVQMAASVSTNVIRERSGVFASRMRLALA